MAPELGADADGLGLGCVDRCDRRGAGVERHLDDWKISAEMVTKYPLLPRAVPLVLGIAVAGGAWIYALCVAVAFVIGAPQFRTRANVLGALAWFFLGASLLA